MHLFETVYNVKKRQFKISDINDEKCSLKQNNQDNSLNPLAVSSMQKFLCLCFISPQTHTHTHTHLPMQLFVTVLYHHRNQPYIDMKTEGREGGMLKQTGDRRIVRK